MCRRFYLVLILFFFSLQIAFAQSAKVTGVVTDNNGVPIDGASVKQRGTNNGAISSSDG